MAKHNTQLRFAAWVIVFVPIASSAQNAAQSPNWDTYGPWHMMHGWGWGFWWIFPVLMMALMVVACVFMMRFFMGHGHSHRDDTSSAVQLLNERFARGEIPKEEYEEKRAILARPR
jgi:putative membrane protein